MDTGSFAAAIESHLELKRRNGRLEATMPIAGYREALTASVGTAEPVSSPVAASVDADAVTLATTVPAAPWDDPDSWWSGRGS